MKRRSLALGIATSGGGVANFAVPPIAQFLINNFGWRGTCLFLGGAAFHLCVLGLLLRPTNIHNRNESDVDYPKNIPDVDQQADGHEKGADVHVIGHQVATLKEEGSLDSLNNSLLQKHKAKFNVSGSIISLHSIAKSNSNIAMKIARVSKLELANETKEDVKSPPKRSLLNFSVFKNVSYLLLCCNNLFILFGVIMVYVHLPAYAVTAGLSKSQGSLLLSFVGIGGTTGRILFGTLGGVSFFSETCIYVILFFVSGIVTALIAATTNFIGLACIGILFGAFYGALCALLPQIIIRILDISLLVSGYGYLLVFDAVGSLSGPPVAGTCSGFGLIQ